ncbi:MAG: hypothetical protein A3K07_01220 [Candidatus Doudnabacteria bacterium RIFCSPHIGHO2_01_43_10]|nr:MAG: hypothetical protein A3K07_01220 [Candidatus Doudnabacteria bacterium RIFCSPHIGHO2_01_43_10]
MFVADDESRIQPVRAALSKWDQITTIGLDSAKTCLDQARIQDYHLVIVMDSYRSRTDGLEFARQKAETHKVLLLMKYEENRPREFRSVQLGDFESLTQTVTRILEN